MSNQKPDQKSRYLKIYLPVALLSAGILFFAGCNSKPEPPPISVTEAQKRFEATCREDHELQVITRMVGQTFYVYYPTDKPLFDYEALDDNDKFKRDDPKKQKFNVQFSNVKLDQGRFLLEYDIVDKIKSSQEDYGYNSAYTESYSKVQNNLFTAMMDSLFNAKAVKGEIEPKFMVMIITDIKKGIETQTTFYVLDFKRFMTGDLPSEEFYSKRILSDSKGGKSFIGDEIGSHIDFKDITMGEFLSKQIINRIGFKFQRSDFPPDPDFDEAIISIVADTTRYYAFNEFEEVRLNNLRSGKKLIFTKEQLASFGDDKPKDASDDSKAKLIHIIFENGKIRMPEDASETTNSEI